MGVPKFYRWISERYPKINQIVSDNALLPEVDHLYLDLNGIIHGCTHPSHMDISDVLSERDMMMGIMHYLDRIITQIAKPKVSVYMAIDGVAPRAKLNQQRSRRFRSAKDLAEATKDMPKGSNVFDSNCITPGTEFLEKVSNVIQYFIRKKIKEDPLWRNLSIIFSGHDIPGEGEHKIMQHIREMRASTQHYQPNTRHCIYGQDADLIMLALVTHEPHFVILREVIDFNFSGFDNKNTLKAVKKFTKESDFQLLHISVLREYLQIEFCKNDNPNEPHYDLERSIDDFVFITFLVGNDFLPHMPTLDIGDGAFDLLFDLYREQRPTWGEGHYLTESGKISDPARLETFLAAIGAVETDILTQREKDAATYLKKKRRWDKRDGKAEGPSDAELKQQENNKQNDYLSMIESMLARTTLGDNNEDGGDFVDGWQPVTSAGQKDYKGRYYFEKMKLTPVDKADHWKLRKSYMEGLMWCLAYYYQGCISWGWYYPYHYGPMLSDLIDIPTMFKEIKFEQGEPLTPFQQLMGCLPPASSALVPPLYRWLMVSQESPIIQFYPANFEVDMNGKKNPWEGVNLLPFIDIFLLKETVAKFCPAEKLSAGDRRRNSLGKIFCYRYDNTCTETVDSPLANIGIPDITACMSSTTVIEKQRSTGEPFKPVLIPGTRIPYPGFPSLNVIPIQSTELVPIGLNCFGSPSKYPTMMLHMYQIPEYPPLQALATNILGKSVFVNWPMMHEGKVVAISDNTKSIRLMKGGKHKATVFDDGTAERWESDAQTMYQMYFSGNGVPGSGGVNIGDIKVRLKLLPLQGMRMNRTTGATTKLFGREEADVPLQLALFEAPAPDPRFIERGPLTLEDRFPVGCGVVLTKGKYRGCKGVVVGFADKKSVGVKVDTIPPELPFGLAIARSVQETYISSVDAARILKMPPGLFGKVTGRLQFEQNKYDLGLNLKSADGSCVIGYTRKKVDPRPSNKGGGKENAWSAGDSLLVVGSARAVGNSDERDDERIQWEFTPKAVRLVQEYRDKFPQLFAETRKNPNEKKYDARKVFGPNGEAWLPVVRKWLDEHETAKLPRTPVSSDSMSREAVAAVQKAADVRSLALKKRGYPKDSLIKIPAAALYREGSTGATDVILASDLENDPPELGDRIVNLFADGIPFGTRGTVVAIHDASTTGTVEVVMDEEFIGGSSLQGFCSNFRGKLCQWSSMLKVAPENTKALVDRLVPKGAGQAAIQKIMSSIERDVKNQKQEPMRSSWDGAVDSGVLSAENREAVSNVSPAPAPQAPAPLKPVTPQTQPPVKAETPARGSKIQPSSTPRSRPGSTERGRQGAWREARGPDGSIGFKGLREGKSGIVRWKDLLDSKKATAPQNAMPVPTRPDNSSAELKALLGLTNNASSMAPSAPVVLTAPPPPNVDDKLKAMLGVSLSPAAVAAPNTGTADAAAGLKAMLGVTNNAPRAQHAPQPPSAAEHLLQLMASKHNMPPMPPPHFQQHTGFNFTYVEEGKDAPFPPPPPPASHMHGPPPPMMGNPYHQGFHPGGFPPGAMHMPPAPMHPYSSYPQHMQHNGPMPFPFHGGGPPPGSHFYPPGPQGPSEEDFPPLGAKPPVPQEEQRAAESKQSDSGVIIPSVITGKGKQYTNP